VIPARVGRLAKEVASKLKRRAAAGHAEGGGPTKVARMSPAPVSSARGSSESSATLAAHREAAARRAVVSRPIGARALSVGVASRSSSNGGSTAAGPAAASTRARPRQPAAAPPWLQYGSSERTELLKTLQRAAARLKKLSGGRSGSSGHRFADEEEYEEDEAEAWVAEAAPVEARSLLRPMFKPGTAVDAAASTAACAVVPAGGPTEQQAAFDDAAICWDFVAGRCKKGNICRYLHLDNEAAKAAAARALARLGRGWSAGGVSEAHRKLAHLFHEGGLMMRGGVATTSGIGSTPATSGATPEQEEEWLTRCDIEREEGSTTATLFISMGSAGLDDLGILAWAFWFDARLEALVPKPATLRATEVDFSGNQIGDYGASVLAVVLEKHGVHCDVLRLNGNSMYDASLKDLVRYLTSSDQATVRELALGENAFSVRGVAWLLACVTLHPAYPVWSEDLCRFEPLRLQLGASFRPDAEDGGVQSEELVSVLQDLSAACHMSVLVGEENEEMSQKLFATAKSNCAAHICDLTLPEGALLEDLAPHARPYFLECPLEAGDVAEGDASKTRMSPCILFDDDSFVVVYKPGGWGCHGNAREGGTLGKLNPLKLPSEEETNRIIQMMTNAGHNADAACIKAWLLLTLGKDKDADAIRDPEADHGLCHRLDLGTSGPMLVGKTLDSYEFAKQQIRDRDVVKDYLALVHGRFAKPRGTCREAIDKSPYEAERRVRIHESGQSAVTLYEVVAEYESVDASKDKYSLVHLRLITGRTHQIRVHMAHMGHPLVGDWKYIEKREVGLRDDQIIRRIFLHKFRVTFMDMDGLPVSISCPLRMDPQLWSCLGKLRLTGGMALHGCDAPGLRPPAPPAGKPPLRSPSPQRVAGGAAKLPLRSPSPKRARRM